MKVSRFGGNYIYDSSREQNKERKNDSVLRKLILKCLTGSEVPAVKETPVH